MRSNRRGSKQCNVLVLYAKLAKICDKANAFLSSNFQLAPSSTVHWPAVLGVQHNYEMYLEHAMQRLSCLVDT